MSEANKAIVRRVYDEIFSAGNLDSVAELVADDAVEHEAIPGIEASGAEAVRQAVTMFRSAFPDLTAHVQDLIADDDRVAARVVFEGTHQGDFMDIPPTGIKVTVEVIDILRIENGLVVEHWGVMDSLGMLQQLGVAPSE